MESTISISGRDIRVPDDLEAYARKKLEKLERYLPNIAEVRLEFSRERTRRGDDLAVAQITIRHQRGAILRSEEGVPGDAHAALNLALDKIYHQIERFKGKQNRKGRERFSATLEEREMAEEAPESPASAEISYADIEAAAAEPIISRHKELLLTPMTEDEAVAQMELLGHTFFIFQNDTTSAINVVYARRDGSFGVIVPRID